MSFRRVVLTPWINCYLCKYTGSLHESSWCRYTQEILNTSTKPQHQLLHRNFGGRSTGKVNILVNRLLLLLVNDKLLAYINKQSCIFDLPQICSNFYCGSWFRWIILIKIQNIHEACDRFKNSNQIWINLCQLRRLRGHVYWRMNDMQELFKMKPSFCELLSWTL